MTPILFRKGICNFMKGFIYRALQKITNQENYIRFHMPGHKGRSKEDFFHYEYDFTEIPGTDNLSNPEGPIKNAINEIAKIYGVKKSFILVNGSTLGIIASILSTCSKGDSFLIPRNSHKSVYSALMLKEINPVYLYDDNTNEPYPVVHANQVEKAFIEYPHLKGLIITSPTYHGVCLDVKSISEVTNKYNKILIVDEAHGAHLKFNKSFPSSSVDLGADIVVQSTHKTLHSLNQGALLHVCSSKISADVIENYIHILQTSSPSYPIMMSVENSVLYGKNKGRDKLDQLIYYYNIIEREITTTPFQLKGSSLLSSGQVFDYDKLKIWIESPNMSGLYLSNILRKKYSIQVEMWDYNGILAMMGMGTEKEDIQRLIYALKDCSHLIEKAYVQKKNVYSYPITKRCINPWEAIDKSKEEVLLEKSLGRICAEFIIPYPPGIPVLVPGEKIDINTLLFLKNWQDSDIIGLKDKKVQVIK